MMNFFSRDKLPKRGFETFDTLHSSNGLTIKRIVSNRLIDGEWYDQREDEWVILVNGSAILEFKDNTLLKMEAGDYLLLEAHISHRVKETSEDALWLAIHETSGHKTL